MSWDFQIIVIEGLVESDSGLITRMEISELVEWQGIQFVLRSRHKEKLSFENKKKRIYNKYTRSFLIAICAQCLEHS